MMKMKVRKMMNEFKRIEFEGDYYNVAGYISNSLLTIYEKDIKEFWAQYKGEGTKIEESGAMQLGTLIHAYILEPETFRNNYFIIDCEIPRSTNQKRFVAEIVESSTILKMSLAEILIRAYRISYETGVENDIVILKKAEKLYENLQKYVEAREAETRGKKVITWAQYKKCQKIKDAMVLHNGVYDIMFNQETVKLPELEMRWQDEVTHVLCKAKMDMVQINTKKKQIHISDIKTTSRDFRDFYENLEKAGYIRQLAFYTRAIKEYLKLQGVEDVEKWKVSTSIVYVNTISENPPYLIGVKPTIIKKTDKDIDNMLWDIKDSIELGWTLHGKPYETDKNSVDKWIK